MDEQLDGTKAVDPEVGWMAISLVLMPFAFAYSGLTLSLMWRLAIVPIFDAPELSVSACVAIPVVIGEMIPRANPDREDKSSLGTAAWVFADGFVRPTVALAIVSILWCIGF